MFWMDAEMDSCEDRANGVLVMESLMEVVMEEWLALAPTVGTDGTEKILINEEEAVPPVSTTPHFPSRVATENVCFIARASSIYVWEHFFDASHSVLLTYNAWYRSTFSLGIKEEQMAIHPT